MKPKQEADQVVFFDGICNLCNQTVKILICLDRQEKLHFSSLQSDYGRKTLHELGLPMNYSDSIIFRSEGKAHQMSDAVLEIFWVLGGIYRCLYVFKIIPRGIRHRIYRILARNRYRWFGKSASCQVPTPELIRRFVE